MAMANAGADIVVHYLHDEAGARATAEQVRAAGCRTHVVQADLAQEEGADLLFDEAIDMLGDIDILVNSAGIDSAGIEVADMPTERWDVAIRTNLYGPFWCCRRFIRIRQAVAGGGKIINVTSIHEEVPRAGAADYDCAKGGLRNLTRTLALELAPWKIGVVNIAPGMVLTPFNQDVIDSTRVREEQVQSIPWKRAANPDEIGHLAVYLASPEAEAGAEAEYVTGASFVIDGGLMQNQAQGA
jgi:glucose 1-dehydrogenase